MNGLVISEEDLSTLCICALRYCHGRQTYMPGLVQGICEFYLGRLSDRTLYIMLEDCKFQERMHLYGDEKIDKPGWLKWKETLLKEKERRESNNEIK